MNTLTNTHTTVVTAADVRCVMVLINRDVAAICAWASHLSRDFNPDEALEDVSLFVLNDVISAVKLEVYAGGEMVTAWKFRICPAGGPGGPAAGQPPSGPMPAGARLRLVVVENLELPEEERQEWLRRRGWQRAESLRYPEGVRPRVYGHFESGGLGVERSILVNSRFDVEVDPQLLATKEGRR